MNERMRHILEQIKTLEDEIQLELADQRSRLLYQIQGRRIEFERSIREKHKELKLGLAHRFLRFK